MSHRTSTIVKVGRFYQSFSPIFTPIDSMFSLLKSKGENNFPVVCLLACPRSGSTLTYQILQTGIESMYLSNILNLLYATPYLGSRIASRFTAGHRSQFKSTFGFVSGLTGEAEGLKFWSYWTGQLLDESLSEWNEDKAVKLKNRLSKVILPNQAFVTGYLGHVFCIEEMRKLFPNILFIHLKRNLIDNAYSIFRAEPNDWFSTKPTVDHSEDNFTRIARQLLSIHSVIFKERGADYLTINFEALKKDPSSFIDIIVKKSDSMGLGLAKSAQYKRLENLTFPTRQREDKIKMNLKDALRIELTKYEDDLFVKSMEELIYD